MSLDVTTETKIDPRLLHLDKATRRGVIRGLEIAGDLTQNIIKRTRSFVDRTGNLRNSILRGKVNTRELSVKVEAGMEYGRDLNDGTRRGIRARRFMERGLAEASSSFEDIFANAIDKEIG